MEVRAVKERSLPEEIWIKIFEIGVSKETNLSIKDISSLMVTCKLFYKLWSKDALWSLLVTLDFPQFANDGGSKPYSSSSQKLLYKYGLARHCKHRLFYFERRLAKLKSEMIQHLSRANFRLKKLTAAKEFGGGICCDWRRVLGKVSYEIAYLEKMIEEWVEFHETKPSKLNEMNSRLQYLVERREFYLNQLTTLLSRLGALCTGSYPISVAHLDLIGDKVDAHDNEDDHSNDDNVRLR